MIALDLFRGAGGWSVACRSLGITDLGVEIMDEANATAEAAGFKLAWTDVWHPIYGLKIDGLIASPPCQTFSSAGNGSGRKALDDVLAALESGAWIDLDELRALGEQVGDERTALVLTPLHYAYAYEPEWIVLEQVPAVLPVWQAIGTELEEMGYSVWTGVLQAEQYGVPQTRKRAMLIASRTREVQAPVPTHSRYYPRSPDKLDPGVKKWVSMAEALGWGLPDRPSPTITGGGTDTGGAEPIAKWARYTSRENFIDTPRTVTTGQRWTDADGQLVKQERSIDHPAPTVTGNAKAWHTHMGDVRSSKGTVRSVDSPAPTITGAMDNGNFQWVERPDWVYERPSTTVCADARIGRPGHKDREAGESQFAQNSTRVTVQEAALLQTFPAHHPWQGNKGKQYLQVGNAVPPLLAEAVIREATGIARGATCNLEEVA